MHTPRTVQTSTPSGWLWPLVLLAACSLLLAACGTADDDPGPLPDSTDDTTGDVGPDDTGDDTGGDDTGDTADDDSTGDDTTDTDTDTTDTTEPIDLRIAGLDGPVQAVYDADGLLHLQCVSDADCVAALGYFHAANRFFFMDFTRLNVRGQIGHAVELDGDIGAGLLAEDVRQRHFMTTTAGEPLEQVMVDGLQGTEAALLERYTAGINTWLADVRAGRNGARLQDEYGLGLMYGSDAAARADKIRDWEPADSMAIALSMFSQLANQSGAEIAQGQVMASLSGLDPQLAADILTERQTFPVATMPASGETFGNLDGADMWPAGLSPDKLDAIADRLAPHREMLDSIRDNLVGPPPVPGDPHGEGSNNWVVAPERTSSGNPLLANDPHLALYNPSLWFVTELDSMTAPEATGTFHVAGGTFPGLPVFLIGHTETVAWGVTTAYWDLADVYVETLTDGGAAVEFDGGTVDILEADFEFMSNGQPVTRTLRWVPHHGPIVSEDGNTALSIRWALHDGSASNDIAGFFGMMRATTMDEAQTAISNIHGANQNFVVIDKSGEIGWFPWVRLPQRPWDWSVAPPWLPLPGDGTAEWGPEPFPLEELPSMRNPSGGFIATANQDHTGAYLDGNPDENMGQAQIYGRAHGARMQRIVDQLEAGGNAHSLDTMLELQADTYMLLGEIVAPALLQAAADAAEPLSAEAADVVAALEGWNYTCPTGLASTAPDGQLSSDADERAESIGCTAFHVTFFELLNHSLGDEALAAEGVERVTRDGVWMYSAVRLVVTALERPEELVSGEVFWDDIATDGVTETRDTILLAALETAAQRLHAATDAEEPGLGSDPSQWLWGRIHTVSLRSPYNTFQDDFTAFNDGPWANDGGLYTVDVANPGDRPGLDYWHGSGASIRIAVELRDGGPVMQVQHPGGTSLYRQGPRYSQLLQRYLTNTPVEMPFGLDAITDPQESLVVNP